MKPHINGTEFGSITVDGEVYDHDIVVRLSGKVKKRKKKLSKERYGTSHTVSMEEAEYIYDDGAAQVIVGTGQYGVLKLSDEAEAFFQGSRLQGRGRPDAGCRQSLKQRRGPSHRHVPYDVLTTNNHTPSILEDFYGRASGEVPMPLRERLADIVDLTDGFCGKHLNDEYRECCRKMAVALRTEGSTPWTRQSGKLGVRHCVLRRLGELS